MSHDDVDAWMSGADDMEACGVLGGTEWDCMRFHCVTQNNAQFKIYELLISEIFHLILSDHG